VDWNIHAADEMGMQQNGDRPKRWKLPSKTKLPWIELDPVNETGN